MVGAAACGPVPEKGEMIAPARTPSPAALPTRPIGTPSAAADAEPERLGTALLIDRGRPCRRGTGPPFAADAEPRWPEAALLISTRRPHERGTVRSADQDSDHWRKLLRTSLRTGQDIGADQYDARYGCGSAPALVRMRISIVDASGLSQVQAYYSTGVLLCGHAHITISLYAHMPIGA